MTLGAPDLKGHTMQLTAPLQITPSLLPGVRIADAHETAWVQIDSPRAGERDLVIVVTLPDGTDVRSDRFSPRGDIRKAMAAALSFLGAAGESYGYRMRKGESEPDPDGNEVLFPAPVPEWAYRMSGEISMMEYELENEEPAEA